MNFHEIFQRFELEIMDKQQSALQKRTVLVRGIPPEYRNQKALLRFFREIFGPKVRNAVIIYNTESIRKLYEARQKALEEWKRAVDIQKEDKEHKIPTHYIGKFPCRRRKVKSIPYYQHLVRLYDLKLKQLQLTTKFQPSDVGFVSFESRSMAMQCVQVFHAK